MFKIKDYILTIYETGSFTKASEKLFISQPSLSATVKRLEERLGIPIFDRSTSPVTLTEFGREYVKVAKEIGVLEDGFTKYVGDIEKLVRGKITIGGSSLFSSFIIPEMVSKFNAEYPHVQFEIIEDSTKNLISGVLDGSIDIILDNAILEDENIISVPYSSERLVMAVPRKFSINEKYKVERLTAEDIVLDRHLNADGINLKAVKDLPVILLRKENDTGKRAEKLFKKYGVTPNVLFYLDQQITAYNVSSTGIGVTFISDTLIKKAPNNGDLYFYTINDLIARRNLYFYQKKSRYISLACKKFIEQNYGK